jgi:hypothetical protein
MFTDSKFERWFRMPRTNYETIRSSLLKMSKFEAVYKQAESVWSHPTPLPALPAPLRRESSRLTHVATVVEGRFAGNEFVQKLAQSTVWARNLSKVAHFGQDFGPYPNFGLGEGPVGECFVNPKRKI